MFILKTRPMHSHNTCACVYTIACVLTHAATVDDLALLIPFVLLTCLHAPCHEAGKQQKTRSEEHGDISTILHVRTLRTTYTLGAPPLCAHVRKRVSAACTIV